MPMKAKLTPEEEKAIRVAFKLDPFIWIGKPYCGVHVSQKGGKWCTREEGHSGPHICTVHFRDDLTRMVPDLQAIWYTTAKNPRRYKND